MGERTNIYNLTDVEERPTPLKIFRQFIPPGGKMIVPVSKLRTRSVQKRLARMQENRSIFVGDAPPAWYEQARRAAKVERRRAQAYKLPELAEPAAEPEPAPAAEPAVAPEKARHSDAVKALRKKDKDARATVSRGDAMKALRKRTKSDLAALAELLDLGDVTTEMTKAKMLLALEASFPEEVELSPPLEKYLED